jgi:hypothetical protein
MNFGIKYFRERYSCYVNGEELIYKEGEEPEDYTECWDTGATEEFPECFTRVVSCTASKGGHWWWLGNNSPADMGLEKVT